MIYFRKRIGEQGVKEILKVSIDLHSKDLKTKEVIIDSTVVEKNITYPTDVKLTKKIIDKCNAISKKEGIKLRQSYTGTTKDKGIIIGALNAGNEYDGKTIEVALK